MEEAKVCGRGAEPGHDIGAEGSEWALGIRSGSDRPWGGTGVMGIRGKSRDWGFCIGAPKDRTVDSMGVRQNKLSWGSGWSHASGEWPRGQEKSGRDRSVRGPQGLGEGPVKGQKGVLEVRPGHHWVKRGVWGRK